MDFFFSQILLIFAVILILFIPGWLLLQLFFDRQLHLLEFFVCALPTSFVLTTFLFLFAGKSGLLLTQHNVLLLVVGLSLLLYFLVTQNRRNDASSYTHISLFAFSKRHTKLIVFLIITMLFVKTIFLANTIFPTSTDLGHHGFWIEKIVQTGTLPVYEERSIVQTDEHYALSDPKPIGDFIIGEHLVIAAIAILADQKVISAYPSLILHLINIFGVLMLFILALRLFKPAHDAIKSIRFAQRVGIAVLLLGGPLYAISGAGTKFISGGVIGNTFGNLLIPAIIYFFYRALREKNTWMLFTAILLSAGLAYTHHLSAFILLFIFVFSIATFLILLLLSPSHFRSHISDLTKLFIKPSILFLLLVICYLLLFVHTPNYLNPSDVGSALGEPTKSTRTGLTPTQLMHTVGEARFGLGLIGLATLLLYAARSLFVCTKNTQSHFSVYTFTFLIGWTLALLFLSLTPELLKINIISGRVANYATLPFILAGGFALVWIFDTIKTLQKKEVEKIFPKAHFVVPYPMVTVFAFLLLTFVLVSGMYDNAQSLRTTSNTGVATQTFHAAHYLGDTLDQEDLLVKDHNFITADAFIKLSFLRDYRYPLSRGFFKRYEGEREQCTLHMISQPNTDKARTCFDDLGVNVVMVDAEEDAGTFLRSDDFMHVYQSDNLSIFVKNAN